MTHRRIHARWAWLLTLLLPLALVVSCGGGTTQRIYHTKLGPAAHSPTFGLPPKGMIVPHTRLTLTPTVEMYDAVTISSIPANARVVAGYTSGLFPTYPKLLKAFPRAIVKSIAISAHFHAQCLDVEHLDAVPSQAARWIRVDRAAGFKRPCIYANLSDWRIVSADLAAAHVPRASYWAWDADWRGCPALDAGFDATQCTNVSHGRSLDESTVRLAFAGIHPKPRPKPLPVCYTHRLTKAQCAAAKAQVAHDLTAVTASRRALVRARQDLHGDHCIRPYRRGFCIHRGRAARVFAQRITYFSAAARAIESTH